jgi:hypothetical protein
MLGLLISNARSETPRGGTMSTMSIPRWRVYAIGAVLLFEMAHVLAEHLRGVFSVTTF